MHTSPSISVIVPIFKAENYLQRCVDSIRNQTLRNIEIILVDDGSPDNSGHLCDRYAEEDARIRVIHKENGGLRTARAAGVALANGEYIAQIDPDDWIDETMLEELLSCAREENADMVICDFIQYCNDEASQKSQQPSALTHSAVFEGILSGTLHASLCNKLILRKLFSQESFLPSSITMLEDMATCVHILTHHHIKPAYLPKAFYHYDCTINPSSISVRNTLERNRAQIRAIKVIESQLPQDKKVLLYSYKKNCLLNMLRLRELTELRGLYSEIVPELSKEVYTLRAGAGHAILLLIGMRIHWQMAYLCFSLFRAVKGVIPRKSLPIRQ